MAKITDDHIFYLDTFYNDPVAASEIGDDADSWALIDDMIQEGLLVCDDDEFLTITQAGQTLVNAENPNEEDDDDEGEPAVYRTFWLDGCDEIEEWSSLGSAIAVCAEYINKFEAERGDAVIEHLESGNQWDIYDFLEANG
jgi:hypothetical protein